MKDREITVKLHDVNGYPIHIVHSNPGWRDNQISISIHGVTSTLTRDEKDRLVDALNIGD